MITCCCDGRVVKALDSKSNGIFPRRFESCSQRRYSFFISLLIAGRKLFFKIIFLIVLINCKKYNVSQIFISQNNAFEQLTTTSRRRKKLDRWLSNWHFAWTLLEHFGSNLCFGIKYSSAFLLLSTIDHCSDFNERSHEERMVCLRLQ